MGRRQVSKVARLIGDRILTGILHGDERAGKSGAVVVPVTYSEPPLSIPLDFLASECALATRNRAAAWGVDLAFVRFDRPERFADRFQVYRSGDRERVFDAATRPTTYYGALRAFALRAFASGA